VPMTELVRILSNMLDRSIIDKTGFAGTFDVHLEFNREAVPGLPGSGAAGVPSDRGGASTADSDAGVHLHCLAREAWAETGIDQGTGRSYGDRSIGKAHRELNSSVEGSVTRAEPIRYRGRF